MLIGVFAYDDFDRGVNRIYNNLVYAPTDNAFQCTAGCVFSNNIAFDAGNNGLQVTNNQLKPTLSPRNIQVLHNTFLRTALAAGTAAFRAQVAGHTVSNLVGALDWRERCQQQHRHH